MFSIDVAFVPVSKLPATQQRNNGEEEAEERDFSSWYITMPPSKLPVISKHVEFDPKKSLVEWDDD